jgi:zinc transport system permease protein
MEFLRALRDYQFLQYALGAGLLVSVACGVVGTCVVVRRITYVAGAISHSVLGGMGAARYLETVHGWNVQPFHGALVSALVAALLIGVVSLRAKQREDTVIGAIWAIGMASGVLFISRTPGYNQDLMSYLFGNILMVSPRELWLIAVLDVVVVAVVLVFYRQILAVCFDEEFARVRGLSVEFYYLLLLCLTALTVVLLVTVVGLVMVIALLTLPVAVAGFFSSTLQRMMGLSVLICAAVTTAGLGLSFGPDLPPGATIVITAGVLYLAVTAVKSLIRPGRLHRHENSP